MYSYFSTIWYRKKGLVNILCIVYVFNRYHGDWRHLNLSFLLLYEFSKNLATHFFLNLLAFHLEGVNIYPPHHVSKGKTLYSYSFKLYA